MGSPLFFTLVVDNYQQLLFEASITLFYLSHLCNLILDFALASTTTSSVNSSTSSSPLLSLFGLGYYLILTCSVMDLANLPKTCDTHVISASKSVN